MSFTFHTSKMSFYRITDPKKRDDMVKDYVSTMKRLRQRDLQDRLGEFNYQQEQERQYKPIIESNAQTVKQIKKVKASDKQLKEEPKEEPKEEESVTLFDELKSKILSKDPDVDSSYGIVFKEDGKTFMGSKPVTIQNDDIVVGSQVYDGTVGLWRLIIGVREDQIGVIGKDFTDDDLLQYTNLLRQTNVLYRDFDRNKPYPRASKSYKWRVILKPLWDKFKTEEGVEEGSGIKFLPSTIKALKKKLCLLVGEYRAGNTTTRNELVAVLDQLRDLNGITEKEYKAFNSKL